MATPEHQRIETRVPAGTILKLLFTAKHPDERPSTGRHPARQP